MSDITPKKIAETITLPRYENVKHLKESDAKLYYVAMRNLIAGAYFELEKKKIDESRITIDYVDKVVRKILDATPLVENTVVIDTSPRPRATQPAKRRGLSGEKIAAGIAGLGVAGGLYLATRDDNDHKHNAADQPPAIKKPAAPNVGGVPAVVAKQKAAAAPIVGGAPPVLKPADPAEPDPLEVERQKKDLAKKEEAAKKLEADAEEKATAKQREVRRDEILKMNSDQLEDYFLKEILPRAIDNTPDIVRNTLLKKNKNDKIILADNAKVYAMQIPATDQFVWEVTRKRTGVMDIANDGSAIVIIPDDNTHPLTLQSSADRKSWAITSDGAPLKSTIKIAGKDFIPTDPFPRVSVPYPVVFENVIWNKGKDMPWRIDIMTLPEVKPGEAEDQKRDRDVWPVVTIGDPGNMANIVASGVKIGLDSPSLETGVGMPVDRLGLSSSSRANIYNQLNVGGIYTVPPERALKLTTHHAAGVLEILIGHAGPDGMTETQLRGLLIPTAIPGTVNNISFQLVKISAPDEQNDKPPATVFLNTEGDNRHTIIGGEAGKGFQVAEGRKLIDYCVELGDTLKKLTLLKEGEQEDNIKDATLTERATNNLRLLAEADIQADRYITMVQKVTELLGAAHNRLGANIFFGDPKLAPGADVSRFGSTLGGPYKAGEERSVGQAIIDTAQNLKGIIRTAAHRQENRAYPKQGRGLDALKSLRDKCLVAERASFIPQQPARRGR